MRLEALPPNRMLSFFNVFFCVARLEGAHVAVRGGNDLLPLLLPASTSAIGATSSGPSFHGGTNLCQVPAGRHDVRPVGAYVRRDFSASGRG